VGPEVSSALSDQSKPALRTDGTGAPVVPGARDDDAVAKEYSPPTRLIVSHAPKWSDGGR